MIDHRSDTHNWHITIDIGKTKKQTLLFDNEIKQLISQSVNQSINQSVSQSASQSINQSINQSVSQSVNQSINQSINRFISVKAWDEPSQRLMYTTFNNKLQENNNKSQLLN